MTGYWPLSFFLCVHGPGQSQGPWTHRKRSWRISSHLDLTLGQKPIFTIWQGSIEVNPSVLIGSFLFGISPYYMASYMSGQEEPNRSLWLATRTSKMELPCPLGTTRRVPQENFYQKPNNKSFIDQDFLFKMAGDWPCCEFMDLDSVLVHKHEKERTGPNNM